MISIDLHCIENRAEEEEEEMKNFHNKSAHGAKGQRWYRFTWCLADAKALEHRFVWK